MNPHRPDDKLRNIRRLIWLYFGLLLVEGAVRKWVLPQFSNPLLIIRDPVVLMIYLLAIRQRVFPRNGWMLSLSVIAFLSLALSFVPLWPYLPPSRIVLVSGFGFRANFLHLPLIFVMARVLRPQDVKRFGWWTLAITVPMAVLMVAQFQAPPDAWINSNAGGEGEMMTSALGKVRTAATFSFVIGVVAYFALAASFLIWAALKRDVYNSWLLFAAGSALVIGIAVSGSRSVVAACAVVVASLAAVFFLRPSAINRFGQTLLVTVVLGFIVMRTPIFKEGFNVLSTRFSEVAESSEKSIGAGLIERVIETFGESLFVIGKAPFLGYGLGVGTNAGAKFLTGRQMFLLSEGEWSRILLESGPLLGLAFVLWRCGMALYIGSLSLKMVRRGNVLPLLIFSSTFIPLMNGQLGQPTILGFVAFATGLTMAALKEEGGDAAGGSPVVTEQVPAQPLRRRSEYASRLHETPATGGQANGSVDR